MSAIKIIRKIEETESMMTPVKEIIFQIKKTRGNGKTLTRMLNNKQGILLASLDKEKAIFKVVFDLSMIDEERIFQLVAN